MSKVEKENKELNIGIIMKKRQLNVKTGMSQCLNGIRNGRIYFLKKNREVTITENNKTHRADIQLNNGLVIEIQNSSITYSNIKKREDFYGKNNMIWILNGQNLVDKSFLTKDVFEYDCMLSISIPKIFPYTGDYDLKSLINNILEHEEIIKLLSK